MAGGERGFAERDKQAAKAFGEAAAQAKVKRIVYLGGLGEQSAKLSAHLASRQATGGHLAAAGVVADRRRSETIGMPAALERSKGRSAR